MPRKISKAALDDIKSLVAAPAATDNELLREEKKRLSEERMKRWPDTLQAQRKRKEEAYLNRLRVQEEERKKMDREEDDRRAQERRVKIEYATKTIYKSTDKVKRLASAEMLSDCLYARGKQTELAERIKAAEREWARDFEVEAEKRLVAEEARVKAQEEERLRKARDVARVQREQLETVRQRHMDELRYEEAEGQKLLERAKRDEEEEIEKQRERLERNRLNHIAVLKANDELKVIKAKAAEREAAEDAKILQYAKEKEELKQRQEAQARKMGAIRQKRREDMIEQGTRRLEELNRNNNQRLEREIAEARRVEDARIKALADKRAAFARTIDESRASQVALREAEKQRKAEADRLYAARWRECNKDAEEQARREEEAERRAARQFEQILLNQAAEKRERALDERREEIFQARSLADQDDEDMEQFKRVAKERIEATKAAGKNPYPLVKCLNDILAGR